MQTPWVIDSDTHVDETDATWEYVDAPEFKPVGGNFAPGEGRRRYWLIDGYKRRRADRDDNVTKTTVETRELLDVPARLRHMDELGVEVQVIYPTLFINPPSGKTNVELNVTRSYNRWIAERTSHSGGRLRWVFVPSPLNIDESVADMRWAKDHGACGVMKKGDNEAKHDPYDPYFFPLYEEAERLNLPICIHTGTGRAEPGDDRVLPPSIPALGGGPVMQGVYALMARNIPAKFPRLRFGAIEAGASWIPLVAHSLKRGVTREHLFHEVDRPQDTSFEANRVYVACQVTEDLDMLLRYISVDNLLVGSDYSHHDISNEMGFISTLQKLAEQEVIPEAAPRKIMYDNPRAFYGL